MKVGYIKKESDYKGTIEDVETLNHLLFSAEEKDWQLYCVNGVWYQVYDKEGDFSDYVIVRLLDSEGNLGAVDMGYEELNNFVDKLNHPKNPKYAKENLLVHIYENGFRGKLTAFLLTVGVVTFLWTIVLEWGIR